MPHPFDPPKQQMKRWVEYTAPAPAFYSVGLDLGTSRDHTVIVVDEVQWYSQLNMVMSQFAAQPSEESRKRVTAHHIRAIERLPLGLDYNVICQRVAAVMERLPEIKMKPQLAYDGTGVGKAVGDMLRGYGLLPMSMVITGGQSETRDGNELRVAKSLLSSCLAVAMDSRRLKIADALPEAQGLEEELQAFTVKRTAAGNMTFEAYTESVHDDRVMALACAVYAAENVREPFRAVRFNLMGGPGVSRVFGPI